METRVTQTFRQLNIRRLIDIIGYDPSQYFKGEMSYENINNLKKGHVETQNQAKSAWKKVSALGKQKSDTLAGFYKSRERDQSP